MNKDLLNKLFIFAAGTVIGSAVTFVVMKRKYEIGWEEVYEEESEENSEEEEESISKKTVEVGKTVSKGLRDGFESVKRDDMVQYNKIIKDRAYSGEEEKKEVSDVEKPYVITVDEYAELDDYETTTLYYFEDGVLTDEEENIIDDVADIVGDEALAKFEEEGLDSVYVRNDARKTDYEILRDMGNYYDRYPREDE